MTIKVLPPQLANQIAAGEVVERPASVVKELVENALDAGATQIDIDIDKGGHKRILVRDNGKGINKAQLTLALARHATSKISDIDDLEAIASLGFRGEALASISSVSRLTMTSKPSEQSEAWSAIAEGLSMEVNIKPAAHPDGTSVEVLDLFFNTPARRKFLRAEKTEFSHIETLIKRIALSRPDVGFVLKHNGRLSKRFKAQRAELSIQEQKSNRIADVINKGFIEQSSIVSCVYDDIEISVWAKSPQLCVSVNPAQYSFVNGRMMRDKLIQHAVRQSYGQNLQSEQLPEYVIFIDLPVTEVDVNVHPAKHEVRFHHSRLLHDLLNKTIQDALAEFTRMPETQVYEPAGHNEIAVNEKKPSWLNMPSDCHQTDDNYKQPLRVDTDGQKPLLTSTRVSTPSTSQAFSGLKSKSATHQQAKLSNIDRTIDHHKLADAMNTDNVKQEISRQELDRSTVQVMFYQQHRYVYLSYKNKILLVDAYKLFTSDNTIGDNDNGAKLTEQEQQSLTMTPLLVPVRLRLSNDEKFWCHQSIGLLQEHGFDLKLHQNFLIIKQVPNILRNHHSSETLPNLFDRMMQQEITRDILLKHILNSQHNVYTKPQVQARLDVLEQQKILDEFIEQNALELNAKQLLEQ